MARSLDIVQQAWKAGVAILAFNVPCLPMVKPVFDRTTWLIRDYYGLEGLRRLIRP